MTKFLILLIILSTSACIPFIPEIESTSSTDQASIAPEPTPTEIIPLEILSINAEQTTKTLVTVTWELSEKATGQVEYGFSTNYGFTTTKESNFNYSQHMHTLPNLALNSTYHYRVISERDDGSRVISEDMTFTTPDEEIITPDPETPPDENPEEDPNDLPIGATAIMGLQLGDTLEIAINNTNVLNTALAGGGKDLIIPAGEWLTNKQVLVMQDTTLTFEGKLRQINHFSSDLNLLRIDSGNVTINNPQLSQKGIVGGHGTHACLAIYGSDNTGNITINGGIIEWGASNNFQGGRNNTIFNGTLFRDSVEHLIYANGINGNGSGAGKADGLIFNDCTFERPGNGLSPDLEANHIQLRNYQNVEINNSIIKGLKKTLPNQYGILATDIDGLFVNETTISDYSAGLLYTGLGTNGVVFNRVTASGDGTKHIRKSVDAGDATFNNCIFNSPYGIYGDTKFNSCTFKPTSYYIQAYAGSELIFDSCTWDYSNSTYSTAFVTEADSSVTLTYRQTIIAPSDGHPFDWGILLP